MFTFIDSLGKKFEVKGPTNLTLDQAKQIFDKQASTGSLTGLKPGAILSAATQAKAGLTSALAQVGQFASGVTGALGAGITGAAGAIGSKITGAVSGAKDLLSKASSAVTGAISTPSTGGIDLAKYAKQATALAPVAGMSVPQVTGVLAQAKNIVGQAADKMTNTKGVGSFGFDLKQLETAGIVKPGTSSLVAAGSKLTASITSVLKSPSVFTGKDGITDSKSLLSSLPSQDKIQQELMAKGSAALKSVGASLDKLSPANAAGLALSAAKSLPNTETFIKGLPLPADIKASINTKIKDGAFAVNLTDIKIPAIFKAETTPKPAADTTNRETLNAAANRILGNDKIPKSNYGPPVLKVGQYDTATGKKLTDAEVQALFTANSTPATASSSTDANGFV